MLDMFPMYFRPFPTFYGRLNFFYLTNFPPPRFTLTIFSFRYRIARHLHECIWILADQILIIIYFSIIDRYFISENDVRGTYAFSHYEKFAFHTLYFEIHALFMYSRFYSHFYQHSLNFFTI